MFEYGAMSSAPTSFKYQHLKDMLMWQGLKPKEYVPLIQMMFRSFVSTLSKKGK